MTAAPRAAGHRLLTGSRLFFLGFALEVRLNGQDVDQEERYNRDSQRDGSQRDVIHAAAPAFVSVLTRFAS
jgi:hypothetical protein